MASKVPFVFTIGTSPVKLFDGTSGDQSLLMYAKADNTGTIHIANNAVSTTNTPPLSPGRAQSLDKSNDETWAVASAPGQVLIGVLERDT